MTTHAKALDELKPCPFCGGKPAVSSRMDEDLSTHNIVEWKSVGCRECDFEFSIPDGYESGTASERWNTRSLPDAPRVREEMIEAAAIAILNRRVRPNFYGVDRDNACLFDTEKELAIAAIDAILALPPATPRPVESEEVTAGRGGVREALRHADIDLSMMLPHANPEMQTSIRKTLVMIDAACINMSIDAARTTAARTERREEVAGLFVSEKDREYAAHLLEDLGEEGISDQEIVAQWLRKVRVETARAALSLHDGEKG